MSGFGPVDFTMPLDPYDDPRPGAKAKLTIPAIALIVVGVLSVLYAIGGSLMSGTYREAIHLQVRQIEQNASLSAEQKKSFQFPFQTYDRFLPLFNGIAAVCGAVIAIGGIQMLSLSARGLCYVSAILSLIPLANCCCCVGLIFGVWAIIVLNLPDVRAGFAFQAHMGKQK